MASAARATFLNPPPPSLLLRLRLETSQRQATLIHDDDDEKVCNPRTGHLLALFKDKVNGDEDEKERGRAGKGGRDRLRLSKTRLDRES